MCIHTKTQLKGKRNFAKPGKGKKKKGERTSRPVEKLHNDVMSIFNPETEVAERSAPSQEEMTEARQINEVCNDIASDLSAQVVEGKQDGKEFQWMLQPPYKGSKAMLKVGNKVDLERSRQVTAEEGKELAHCYDAKFIETSAGLEHNVDELLVGVLKQILLRQDTEQNPLQLKVRR